MGNPVGAEAAPSFHGGPPSEANWETRNGSPFTAATARGPGLPAWRRPTSGEHRWPSVVAIAAAIVMQLVLPDRLLLHPRGLLPGVEIALLVALILANPVRLIRRHTLLRLGALALVIAMTLANAGSAALLIDRLLTGQAGGDALSLFGSGAAIYSTNIIAFAVWYWELDRGGPFARAAGDRQHTDFLFSPMTAPDVAPPN